MDPLSIAVAVAALVKLAGETTVLLTVFIKDTKNVNDTIQALSTEVDNASSVIKLIDSLLTHISQGEAHAAEITNNSERWEAISSSLTQNLTGCRGILETLRSTFQPVEAQKRSFGRQAIRQLKLNLKDNDIKTSRSQLHTYTGFLQTSLQMLNVHISCMTRDAVLNDLEPNIDKLVNGVSKLGTEDTTSDPFYTEFSIGDIQALKRSAQIVASSARSVLESSDRGSFIERPRSVLIPATINEDGDEDQESDPEEGFELDRFKQYIESGEEAFSHKKYREASPFLQRAYALAQTLPHKHNATIDTTELQFKIGTCYFHQNLHDECKAELSQLINAESTSKEDAARILSATNMLARTCLRKSEIDDALAYGRKSIIGHRKLFGDTHPTYYVSLRLLSQIYLAKGDEVEAGVYSKMIPTEAPVISNAVQPLRSNPRPEKPLQKIVIDHALKTMARISSLDKHPRMCSSGITSTDPSDGAFDKLKTMRCAIEGNEPAVVRLLLEGWTQKQRLREGENKQIRQKVMKFVGAHKSERRSSYKYLSTHSSPQPKLRSILPARAIV